MTDRIPIYSTKAAKSQIGYTDNGGAFDLSDRRLCNYDAATGNLSDPATEKIVGYVSKEGNFVVPSRIATELFERPSEDEHGKEYVAKSNRPPVLNEPSDAFLERVKEMMQNFKNETS
jgi:hypothetical protein